MHLPLLAALFLPAARTVPGAPMSLAAPAFRTHPVPCRSFRPEGRKDFTKVRESGLSLWSRVVREGIGRLRPMNKSFGSHFLAVGSLTAAAEPAVSSVPGRE